MVYYLKKLINLMFLNLIIDTFSSKFTSSGGLLAYGSLILAIIHFYNNTFKNNIIQNSRIYFNFI